MGQTMMDCRVTMNKVETAALDNSFKILRYEGKD